MIPKIIHYCWLSDEPWNEIQQKCFKSWNKVLEGYEFKKWDQQSLSQDISSFYSQMVRSGNWAFASDYVRLYALYHYGGIYVDMDVEIIKSLNPLLHNPIFIGLEDKDEEYLGCHIIGAEPNHPFIKGCLQFYDRSWRLKWSFPPTMPRIITKIAKSQFKYEWPVKSKSVFSSGLTVYPAETFSPISYKSRKKIEFEVHAQSYVVHYWLHSWSWFDDDFISSFKKIPWLFMNKRDWRFIIKKMAKKLFHFFL